jgi:hypothetical protein
LGMSIFLPPQASARFHSGAKAVARTGKRLTARRWRLTARRSRLRMTDMLLRARRATLRRGRASVGGRRARLGETSGAAARRGACLGETSGAVARRGSRLIETDASVVRRGERVRETHGSVRGGGRSIDAAGTPFTRRVTSLGGSDLPVCATLPPIGALGPPVERMPCWLTKTGVSVGHARALVVEPPRRVRANQLTCT